MTRRDRLLVARFEREARRWAARWAADLERAFRDLAGAVLARVDQRKDASDDWPPELRLALEDGGAAERLVPPGARERWFAPVYERHWQLVGEATCGVVSEHLGVAVGWNLSDPETVRLLLNGGSQITRLDVAGQTRAAIVQALRDGRAAGEGAADLARRIRGYVEGRAMYPGVYQRAYDAARGRGHGDAAAQLAGDRAARQYRAETIARTETKTAQNRASVSAYRKSDVVAALRCFDGAGCGWTGHKDPNKANGRVVSFEDAERHPLAHPRCVRSFAPVVRGG